MLPQERIDYLKALHDSRAEFAAAAAGLSEAQARNKPTPERWSVLECVEHIVIVERRMLHWLENPDGAAEAPAADHAREAHVLVDAAIRGRRIEAPEPVKPKGQFATLAEALEGFHAGRAKMIAFAEQPGLYGAVMVHPRLGPLNGAEAMCFVAAHSRRHAEQIREVRAEL